ncbi:beta-lactamase-like protein [Aspergillus cavernicola]|uniref:hydroxyacylglutathione hydrolase n=1 Tax=Aspergillus cavernicola TaxID=176166 RepID=A0ABR4IQK1_9EURO
MAKVIFTPWKTHSELLAVRNQFYPIPEYDGPDMRSHACATVGAWKMRGNLPHPVEATALLTDAILHDDAVKNSVFSIRATYAAAFCRFVTGLVDSKLYGARKTMFGRALDLGLPASFVELRHEATHRELPSLTVLRDSTERSLEWLWGFYWGRVEYGPGSGGPGSSGVQAGEGEGEDGVRGELRRVLGSVEGVFEGDGDELARKKKRRKLVQQALVGVSGQVVSILNSTTGASAVLAQVMLREGILVPAGRRLGDSLSDVIAKWDPLLQMIVEGDPSFLVTLTEAMVDELAFSSSSDSKTDPYCEGVYTWLDHILRSAQWDSQRRVISYSYILAVCKGSLNHWTTLLRKSIGKGTNMLPETSHQQSPNEAGLSPELDEDEDLKTLLSKYGWETVDTWDSRPLGIVLTVKPRPLLPRSRAMHIKSLPMWTGKGNNYAYLVTDEPTKQSVIIDPANPPEVVPELEAQSKAGKINLTAIVNTHHHWDHAGGNNEVLKAFKVPIIGGKECQSVTTTPAHGEVFKIGDRISVTALHTPCHTQDSICYFMQDGEEKVVFTGDTLFIGGCGRFFEGTAPEMHKALNETLASLPDDTKVYPGHEYTKANVKFCLAVSQSEPIKKLQAFADANQQTQGKFTIGDEKLHNVFMRVNDPKIQKKTGKTDPIEVMAALREMKNAM